ncbi:HAD family hydrolase [Agrococcus casei]|uniref:HAD-superfamily hydrolase, subfamily IIB n=3 Tax=Agrococcus TaxID=46352 RepID=A0A1R4G8M0_9MICO|nr:HAD family hydrolase [Agrococcus casei]SJM64519.1 HAD-superfamily hydrolase, subfamily IIB [Agrococcus casei LMG 22410]
MTARRLVALDVDGTIVHEDNTLSRSVYDTIREVGAAGHEIVIATGRSYGATFEVCHRLDIRPAYLVCANGAQVMRLAHPESDGEDAYVSDRVEVFDAGPVLERVRERFPEGNYMVENGQGVRRYTNENLGWDISAGERVPFERLAEEPAMRVVVESPSHDAEEFLAIVDGMGLHRVSYTVGFSSWLDISPDGVNKSTGLDYVIEKLGIARDRVFSAGDGRNDIEMLQWTAAGGGVAVSMGQAPKVVHDAANQRTGDVLEDGLVDALRTHVL